MNYYETWNELLKYRATEFAEQRVFTFLGENQEELASLTYAQLYKQAKNLAGVLKEKGQDKDRILLLYPAGLDYVVAFYACLYAGMIAVPLYSPQNIRKIELISEIAKDSGARLALSTQKYLDKVSSMSDSVLNELEWLATDRQVDTSTNWQDPIVKGADVAYLQYTSGSTSLPKGVVLTHETTLFHSEELSHHWHTTQESVLVSWLPHFHDLGQVFSILQPVYKGFHSVLMSPTTFIKQPYIWLKAISDYRATHSCGPDFAYSHSVKNVSKAQLSTLNLSSWLVAINAAEPVRANTIRAFYDHFAEAGLRESTQCPSYGLAESTLVMVSDAVNEKPYFLVCNAAKLRKNQIEIEIESSSSQILVSNGKTELDTQVKIVDIDNYHALEESQIGEIWLSGKSIAAGYWQNPEATEETFKAKLSQSIENREYLRTGDLGFIYEGNLYITGRLKDLIVIRGTNHYPQDIEQTVELSHGLIRNGYCAAFSVENEDIEQLVVVAERNRYYVGEIDYDEVFDKVKKTISARHNLDVSYILIVSPGSITKTTSGKIQRRKCKTEFLNSTLKTVAKYQNKSIDKSQEDEVSNSKISNLTPQKNNLETVLKHSIEAFICSWIANRINISVAQIELRKSFFDYGLNSMDTFSFHSDLEAWLQKPVAEELVWESHSIESLINALASLAIGTFEDNKKIKQLQC
ncbi:AMP-binding protein [Xenorhabdus taiwanensis]|uniref:Fatty acyl-AMP ligase n=1 Tax=Xenorhabdus taiwanensis TaxID=3085177 RepID=A0ABM8JTD9_9GAMM|nr:fatty acyl-AMP ligase [Xenorhabdus sp. TCT-1]